MHVPRACASWCPSQHCRRMGYSLHPGIPCPRRAPREGPGPGCPHPHSPHPCAHALSRLRVPQLVYCSSALKFLTPFEQGTPHFHFVPGPANYVARPRTAPCSPRSMLANGTCSSGSRAPGQTAPHLYLLGVSALLLPQEAGSGPTTHYASVLEEPWSVQTTRGGPQ